MHSPLFDDAAITILSLLLCAACACDDSAPPPDADVVDSAMLDGGGMDGDVAVVDSGAADTGSADAADAGPDARPPDTGATTMCAPSALFSGEGTSYPSPLGRGACSFLEPVAGEPLMVAAISESDSSGPTMCGACAAVTGPAGTATVRIFDRCPDELACTDGDIVVSEDAFMAIAGRPTGRAAASWRFVPCEVTGAIRYHFRPESSEFALLVQVRNHRHAVERVEVRTPDDGSFRSLTRTFGNYFMADGLGAGPFTFRLTDVHGQTVTDEGIPLSPDEVVEGTVQFPECS